MVDLRRLDESSEILEVSVMVEAENFSQLNKTHWIIVPRQDDSCYFYNTLTGISIEPHN